MYQANMDLLSFVLMWGTKSEQDVTNIVVKKYGTIERDYSDSAPIEFSNEKHSSLSGEKNEKIRTVSQQCFLCHVPLYIQI